MNTRRLLWSACLLLGALLPPIARAQAGIKDDSILIGRTVGLTGPIAARTKPTTEAIAAYFDQVNAEGGVHGRKLVLINMDDTGDPKQSADNARKLAAVDKVFLLFSVSGTPQTRAVLPVLTEYQIPLFATTAGAPSLRTYSKLMFHTKASYADEVNKMAQHFAVIGLRRIAIVHSDDGAGNEGGQVAALALETSKLEQVANIGFKAGGGAKAAADLLAANAQAVIYTGIPGPTPEFFREFVKLPVRPQVFAWSAFVVEQVYKEIGDSARGMVIAQVVPSPTDGKARVVRDYLALLAKAKLPNGGYPGLEAYINARILVEGLKRTGKSPTRVGFIAAVEGMRDFNLGNDFVNFSSADHVGRRLVELSIIGEGGKLVH